MHGIREEEAVGVRLEYPHGDVARLRLLLGRRVLWLRRRWAHNPLRDYRGMVISDQQADELLAAGDEAAEQAFYRADPEAVRLTEALEEHTGRLAERDADLAAAATPTPLQRLAAILGLSPFEQDVLLFALATEVAPAIADLYAYMQDDASRRSPTLELALSVSANDEPSWFQGRRLLIGQTSFQRFSLIVPEPGAWPVPSLQTGYRLDDRIRDYLLGANRVDDRVAAWVREVPSEPLVEVAYPSELERIEELVRASVARLPDWLPVVNLVGPDLVDRPGLARGVCDRLGVHLLRIDLAALPTAAGERAAALRLLEREALLTPAAFYLDLPRPAAGEPAPDPTAVLDELGALLFAGTRRPLPPAAVRAARPLLAVEIAPLGPARRHELWSLVAGGDPDSDDGWLDRLTEQFQVGPVEIRRAAEAAGRLADPPLAFRDLWRACQIHAGADLDDLAQRLEPGAGWADLVLPADSEQALREVAAQLVNQTKVYEGWGFGAKLRRGRGISVLFSGPSGTGKTMAAEVLASALSLDLYRVDLSGVVSKYIGETEKNLRRVFDAAASGGAVLFFDEADALFGRRSEVKDSHDRYANIEINYLLQRMEDYQGLAVLATNMKSALDPAFLRRLRFQIEFPFPDAELRERIWRGALPARAEVDELDYELLCAWEITGGNIRNIAVNAAFQAAADGVPIGMPHLLRAARREYAKIGKLPRGAEFAVAPRRAGP